MITFTRSLARQLRAVLRHAGIGRPRNGPKPPLVFRADRQGLHTQVDSHNVCIQHFAAGRQDEQTIYAPLELLEACSGTREEPVTLDVDAGHQLTARWHDRDIPQFATFDGTPPKPLPAFPKLPTDFKPNNPGLWTALRHAGGSADVESTRYALGNILWQPAGQLITTNGRQLFSQRGFEFPFAKDLMVPALGVLGCKDLAIDDGPVGVGADKHHLGLSIGNWCILLRIETEGRFPTVTDLVNRPVDPGTTLTIAEHDAQWLAANIPRLPGNGEDELVLTLDLAPCPVVRARATSTGPATELALVRSRVEGEPMRLNIPRRCLLESLRMGFRVLQCRNPDSLLRWDEEQRTFVFMPCQPKGAIAPTPDAVRLEAPPVGSLGSPNTSIRSHVTMPRKQYAPASAETGPTTQPVQPAENNRHAGNNQPVNGTPVVGAQAGGTHASGTHVQGLAGTPLEQAIALRQALRQTLDQTNQLIVTLRRQKRQQRLMQTTLATLRELKTAAV